MPRNLVSGGPDGKQKCLWSSLVSESVTVRRLGASFVGHPQLYRSLWFGISARYHFDSTTPTPRTPPQEQCPTNTPLMGPPCKSLALIANNNMWMKRGSLKSMITQMATRGRMCNNSSIPLSQRSGGRSLGGTWQLCSYSNLTAETVCTL